VLLDTIPKWLVEKAHQLTIAALCAAMAWSWTSHGIHLHREINIQPLEKSHNNTSKPRAHISDPGAPLLFGQAERSGSQLQARNIPATTLNLKLRGVLAGDPFSSAIIENQNGQSHLYNVGDRLAQDIILLSVHKDSVVINHKGRLQRILFPELTDKAPTQQNASSRSTLALPAGPLSQSPPASHSPLAQHAPKDSSASDADPAFDLP